MRRRTLERIQQAVRDGNYDMTAHAVEEMAEDQLDIADVEAGILSGALVKTAKDDPRGKRYAVHGIGADGQTPVGTVGRFTGAERYLIITVYEVTEAE